MTYESTWFSKDKMMGKGEVLKAHSAIASITSWKTEAEKKRSWYYSQKSTKGLCCYDLNNVIHNISSNCFRVTGTVKQFRSLYSSDDHMHLQGYDSLLWFPRMAHGPSPDSLPEPSEIDDCIRDSRNISLADRKKNKWDSTSLNAVLSGCVALCCFEATAAEWEMRSWYQMTAWGEHDGTHSG